MKKLWYLALLTLCFTLLILPMSSAKAKNNNYFDPDQMDSLNFKQESIIISKDADFTSWTNNDIYPSVKEIYFEEGIETIEKVFFNYFPNVEKVVLPMSMKEVGKSLIPYEYESDIKGYEYSLKYLTTIEVHPENLVYTSMEGALYTKDLTTLVCYPCGNKSTSYTMPEFVEFISRDAFGINPYLTKLTLGTRYMPDYIFYYCGYLPNLKEYAVASDSIYLSVQDGVLFNWDQSILISFPQGKVVTIYQIPECVKKIGLRSFVGVNIKTLKFPAGTSLNDFGLGDEDSYDFTLYDVTENSKIEAIQISPEDEYYATEDGVLYNKEKTYMYYWPQGKKVKTLKFPSTLVEIWFNDSFPCKDEITELIVPRDCKYFVLYDWNCKSLKTIKVEKGNKIFYVKDGLLYRYNELRLLPPKSTKTVITIPAECNGSFNIDAQQMPSVKKIIIEGSGANISYTSFPNLEKFELKKGNKKAVVINQVLYSADKKTMIWYPQAKKSTSFTLPSTVTTIPANAFYHQKYLQTITLSKKLKSYDYYDSMWFTGCKKLSAIKVASGNATLTAKDGVLYTKDMKHLLYYPAAKSNKSFTLPDSVQYFLVACPNNIQTLTLGAKFKEFNGVYNYNSGFFEKFTKLSKIKVSSKNKNYYVRDNVLYQNVEGDEHLILYPIGKKNQTFNIAESVYYIPYYEDLIHNPYLKSVTTDSNYIRVCGKKAYSYYKDYDY